MTGGFLWLLVVLDIIFSVFYTEYEFTFYSEIKITDIFKNIFF